MATLGHDNDHRHGLLAFEDGLVQPEGTALLDGGEPPLDDRRIKTLLYTSHFLSAWNSRVFEFGAFLFLASMFPRTLLPASVYALTGSVAASICSPWIGSRIDRADRMTVIRESIIGQRIAVALSSLALLLMSAYRLTEKMSVSIAFIAVISILSAVEKVCAIENLISVERDWVVVIAGDNEDRLRSMSSQMRRIDLFCKLVGPMAVSLIDGISTEVAISIVAGMTCFSLPIEYFTIARVIYAVPALRARKSLATDARHASTSTTSSTFETFRRAGTAFAAYAGHPAFLPSFSLALLYATVLSFSGPMTTYLLALGIRPEMLGVIRGISTVFEMSATWLASLLMARISPIRAGIWFINWQLVCVALALLFFWLKLGPIQAATGVVMAVIASRVGLWGFDLSVQTIVQEEVEADMRGAFSSQEFALHNAFEVFAFASTIVFHKPEQFKYPAAMSVSAVGLAGTLYAVFVRSRRGHLLHASRCMEWRSKHPTHTSWTELRQEDHDEIELHSQRVA